MKNNFTLVCVAVTTTVATWLILSIGMTAVLNLSDPFAARRIYGGDATTRLFIMRDVEPKPKGSELAARFDPHASLVTRKTAIEALKAEPLSAEAFRQLARAAQQEGDQPLATAYLAESFRRFFRNPNVATQLLMNSLISADTSGILEYCDALLRSRIDLFPSLQRILLALADQRSTRAALISKLATAPPWRSSFLQELGRSPGSEDAYMEIYNTLRGTNAAFSKTEVSDFLFALAARNRIDQALTIWLALLPPKDLANLPMLYNGEFLLPVNDSPFNWSIYGSTSAAAEISELPGDPTRRGLNIKFSGQRAVLGTIEQRTSLLAGQYFFTGRFMSDDFRNSRGLVWRIYCNNTLSMVAESERLLGGGSGWRSFNVSFTVPSSGCQSQIVRLELAARIASEQIAFGSVWMTKFAISAKP